MYPLFLIQPPSPQIKTEYLQVSICVFVGVSVCKFSLFFGFGYFELIWKCPSGCPQNDAQGSKDA